MCMSETVHFHICFVEDSIGAFMAFYCKIFATHLLLPKMHLLEVHVVLYLKQWHMGFGFLGAQGVELKYPPLLQ